ncbi:probable cyclic nucleotide-gated ion channel 10 [Fagus crenata]
MEEEKEKIKEEKREIDIWIFKHKLPSEMKSQISQKVIERLEKKKDVHVENLFHHLPQELGKAVKRYLCLDLLKKKIEPFAAYVAKAAWRRHHENKNLELAKGNRNLPSSSTRGN